MFRPTLIVLLMFFFLHANAQDGYILLKKHNKPARYFWKNGHFTFQLKDKQWLSGTITGITPDSFYFTREIVRSSMIGFDTLHFSGYSYSLDDINALPKRKQSLMYVDDRVVVTQGREKFLWVKNGFIFRVAGAGYLLLNITNHLIDKDPPFAKDNLANIGIGAVIFLVGEVLHLRYRPYIYIGKKYHLEVVILNTPGNIPRR